MSVSIGRRTWILGDLDLTWGGLGVVEESFDPGQSGGSGRTLSLTVLVSRLHLSDAADVQALLDLECAKRTNVLTFHPDGFGAPTRYIVGEATVTTEPWEQGERRGLRRVALSWPVLGWPTTDEVAVSTGAGGARLLAVGGSRPSALTLDVSASSLGTVLACTQPDLGPAWTPGLRQWTASPNTGSSLGATFHPSQTWKTSFSATIPQASVQRGPHALVARLYRASAGTESIGWVGNGWQGRLLSVRWASGGAMIVPLGVLVLDPDDGDGVFTMSIPAGVYVDEVFAAYAGEGSGMVVVNAGSATAMKVEAPALSNRLLGRVTVGGKPSGLSLIASSDLPVVPPSSRLYVASTSNQTLTVAASWRPAVQTHAVEV